MLLQLVIKSNRIMNEKKAVTLTYGNILTIDIPWRPVYDVHNVVGPVNVTPQRQRPIIDDQSPAKVLAVMNPYYTLQEAFNRINSDVNVYAVLVSVTGIKPSKGNDKYCVSYCLLDHTQPNSQYPIVLSLFSNHIENFPVIRAVGDILRIRRVRAQLHQGKLQLVGNVDHSKGDRRCSILVIHRRRDLVTGGPLIQPAPDVVPPTSSSSSPQGETPTRQANNFGLSSDDWEIKENSGHRYDYHVDEKVIIEHLHAWSQDILFQQPLLQDTHDIVKAAPLNFLYHRRYFGAAMEDLGLTRCDTLAMVIEVQRHENGKSLVKVWDGSTPGELTLPAQSSTTAAVAQLVANPLTNEISRSLLAAHNYASSHVNADPTRPQNLTLNPTLRGCAVTLSCQGPNINHSISGLKPGMWVRFRNLHLDYDPSIGIAEAEAIVPVASIYTDTHVCPLLPCYR
jgi:hypothetical protein